MISLIREASQAQPAAQPSASHQSAPQAKPQSHVTDTVQLSGAKALVQETLETPVQTAKEANAGDVQARRLLAKEAAAAKAGLK